jgi:hypothetical protein
VCGDGDGEFGVCGEFGGFGVCDDGVCVFFAPRRVLEALLFWAKVGRRVF